MTTTGTWYAPALGTGQFLSNPPFKMNDTTSTTDSLTIDEVLADHIPDATKMVDDRGLLPMIISETGSDDEPEQERIICSSISGGADYVADMPREVSLERIVADGRVFRARYLQGPLEVAPSCLPADGEVGGQELLTPDELRDAWNAQADASNDWDVLDIDEIVLWTQQQALSRWGTAKPQPPAAGEVGELVARLRDWHSMPTLKERDRAAKLLERQRSLVEALRRLRKWGGLTGKTGYSADAVLGVIDWIDTGMTGDLPPLSWPMTTPSGERE